MIAPKREKMARQRSMTQKKGKERERGSHVSKKRDDTRERTNALRRNATIHSSIHLHLLIKIA